MPWPRLVSNSVRIQIQACTLTHDAVLHLILRCKDGMGWGQGRVDKGNSSFCPSLSPGWRALAPLHCTRRWMKPFTSSCASPTCMYKSRSGGSVYTDSSRWAWTPRPLLLGPGAWPPALPFLLTFMVDSVLLTSFFSPHPGGWSGQCEIQQGRDSI